MFVIMYIVLIVMVNPLTYPALITHHMVESSLDKEIVDEWVTTSNFGRDSLTSCKANYKAVLFASKEAKDRFLRNNYVGNGAVLIDIKKGKQINITQNRVNKIVIKENHELDHYEVVEGN